MLLVASTEIVGQVMKTLINILVVSGEAEMNNANSHRDPKSVHLVLQSQISMYKITIIGKQRQLKAPNVAIIT